jgi:magnesium transporter
MIAGIYGMNFHHMPELSFKYGYFVVLGVMATLTGFLYRTFRKNDWL